MKDLIAYLIENMFIDIQGDLSIETLRGYLKNDDSREAKALLSRVVEDKGVSEMMVTLTECLQDYLRTGINDVVVREQLRTYSES
ncbi:MAG: hypothetical protein EXR73_12915 [Myxococcales bacterium]|nr:hypothetical protein [Myxococcales bacterium]